MKRLLLLIFLLPSVASAQLTESELQTHITEEIRSKKLSEAKVATAFDLVNTSKVGYEKYTFPSNVTFVFSGGKTFGKYSSGQTAPWQGLTIYQALMDAFTEYLNPAFTYFTISGQPTTVEVGTSLNGGKTFTWGIDLNSGTVSSIDLYNVSTSTTMASSTPNDGTQLQVITTVQLNSNGATQVYKGILHDTNVVQNISSSNFTITSRFLRFFGPTGSSPANSAAVRALPSNTFHTGATTFTLATGTIQTKFVVALPPGVTIASVIDTGNLNANITTSFVLTGTITVLDAGGTSRLYNLYEYNVGAPYPVSTNLSITTNN